MSLGPGPARLSLLIACLALLASGLGLAAPGLYRDNLLVSAGWRGNDLVTLLVAVPLLLASLRLARRGSERGRLLWLGTLLYFVYSYAFYLFGAAFNRLFLVYVALFASSLYGLVFGLAGTDARGLAGRFAAGTPFGWVAAWLVALALTLGGVHVGTAVGAMVTGRVPGVVTATGHPTNLVAALDLSLVVVPGLLAARWLRQGESWGVVLAALLNVKGAVYMAALTAATLAAARAGAPIDARQGFLWAGIGFGCLLAAAGLLGGLPGRPALGVRPNPGVD